MSRGAGTAPDLDDSLAEAHLVTNRSGVIIGASRMAAAMLSTPQNRLAGRPLELFLTAGLRPDCVVKLKRVVSGKQVPEWSISLKRSRGPAVRAKVRLQGILGRRGDVVAVGWTLRAAPLTGASRAALRHAGQPLTPAPSRLFTDDVLNITTVGLLGLDASHQIAWMNETFEQFFKVGPDLIGRDYGESLSGELHGIRFEPADSLHRAAAGEEFECRIIESRTGRERWLKHSSVPAQQRFDGVESFEIYRDITSEKFVQGRMKEGFRPGALSVELGSALTGGGSLGRILQKAARILGQRLHLLSVRIWLLDSRAHALVKAASFGQHLDAARQVTAADGPGRSRAGGEMFPLSASQVEWAAERGLVWHRQSIGLDGVPLGTIMTLANQPLTPRSCEALRSASDALALCIRKDRAERQVHLSRWKLSRLSAELRVLVERLMSAEEEERRHLSRELHDDLNQTLAIAVVEVESLCQKRGGLPSAARVRLDGLRATLVELSDHVRHVAYHLHPSILDDLGLAAALRSFSEEFTRREKIEIDFQVLGKDGEISKQTASCLYRVAQESLRNIARHAQTGSAQMRLATSSRRVQLSVRDTGVGFRTRRPGRQGGGLGLISMRERVRMVKGRFVVRSRPGSGTYVFASIPRASSR